MLVNSINEDMLRADLIINAQGCDMCPEWAGGAALFLAPEDVPSVRAYIEQEKTNWPPPRLGPQGAL